MDRLTYALVRMLGGETYAPVRQFSAKHAHWCVYGPYSYSSSPYLLLKNLKGCGGKGLKGRKSETGERMSDPLVMKFFKPTAYWDMDSPAYWGCDFCGGHDRMGVCYGRGRRGVWVICCEACVLVGQPGLDDRLRERIAEREGASRFKGEIRDDPEYLRGLIGRVMIPTWEEWKAAGHTKFRCARNSTSSVSAEAVLGGKTVCNGGEAHGARLDAQSD
jgi:hypothetical protein